MRELQHCLFRCGVLGSGDGVWCIAHACIAGVFFAILVGQQVMLRCFWGVSGRENCLNECSKLEAVSKLVFIRVQILIK